jgi:hypothetical protein
MLGNFCVLRLHITRCDVELLDLNVSELVFGWVGFSDPLDHTCEFGAIALVGIIAPTKILGYEALPKSPATGGQEN